jgi:hypothetical protein
MTPRCTSVFSCKIRVLREPPRAATRITAADGFKRSITPLGPIWDSICHTHTDFFFCQHSEQNTPGGNLKTGRGLEHDRVQHQTQTLHDVGGEQRRHLSFQVLLGFNLNATPTRHRQHSEGGAHGEDENETKHTPCQHRRQPFPLPSLSPHHQCESCSPLTS